MGPFVAGEVRRSHMPNTFLKIMGGSLDFSPPANVWLWKILNTELAGLELWVFFFGGVAGF